MPFKETDQQQPEIDARRHRRPSQPLVKELRAPLLTELVELRFVEDTIQSLVERVARCLHLLTGVEQCLLLRTSPPFSHRHTQS
jgi:hypothetical protein